MQTEADYTSEPWHGERHCSPISGKEERRSDTFSTMRNNRLSGGAYCNGLEAGVWQNATVYL